MLLKFMCTFLHKEELYLNALKLMDPDEVFPKERAIQALLCIDNGSFSLPSVLLLISYLGPIYNTSSKWVGLGLLLVPNSPEVTKNPTEMILQFWGLITILVSNLFPPF